MSTALAETRTDLTAPESARLAELESVVSAGIRAFFEVGAALREIRESRLYRTEFETFEEYCEVRWDMTSRRGNQLVASSELLNTLGTIVPKPSNEAQSRPLTRLTPDEQVEAWQAVLDRAESTGGKITAALVQQVVDEMFGEATEPDSTEWDLHRAQTALRERVEFCAKRWPRPSIEIMRLQLLSLADGLSRLVEVLDGDR